MLLCRSLYGLLSCIKINRKLSIGSWITISHSSVVEIMADAGFEWLVLDLEHSPMSIEKSLSLISIIQGKGLKALVRVGQNDPLIISTGLMDNKAIDKIYNHLSIV